MRLKRIEQLRDRRLTTLKHDELDLRAFEDMLHDVKNFGNLCERVVYKLVTGWGLLLDVFVLLYSRVVEPKSERELFPGTQLNAYILDTLAKLPQIASLRGCGLDPSAPRTIGGTLYKRGDTAWACLKLVNEILDAIPDEILQQANQMAQAGGAQAPQGQQQEGGDDDGSPDGAGADDPGEDDAADPGDAGEDGEGDSDGDPGDTGTDEEEASPQGGPGSSEDGGEEGEDQEDTGGNAGGDPVPQAGGDSPEQNPAPGEQEGPPRGQTGGSGEQTPAPVNFKDLAKALKDSLDKNGAALMAALEESAEQTKADQQILADVLASQGWDLSQEMPKFDQDPEKALELARKLKESAALRSIIELFGKAFTIDALAAQEQKATGYGYEAVVHKLGREIEDADSFDRALLANPKTKRLAMLRVVREQLWVEDYREVREFQGGDVVVLLDASGSTGRHLILPDGRTGTVLEMIKGIALAIQQVCIRQGRKFTAIPFTHFVQGIYELGPLHLDELIHLAGLQPSGGTNFVEPLVDAFKEVARHDERYPPDIVLITDGEAPLSPEQVEAFKQLKEVHQARIRALYVHPGYRAFRDLDRLCGPENVFEMREEIDKEALKKVFSGL